jgi:hypothetical protein
MRHRTAAALGLLTLALAAGCAGWHRTQLSEGQRLPPRQQVRVWQHGDSRIVHAGLVRHDTLFAVPFTKPPGCDSCRIAIPMSEVDSLEFGNSERTGVFVVLLPFALAMGFLIAISIIYGGYGD